MMRPDPSFREKPLVIPIFITHRGCPNRCVYCNQNISAGPFDTYLSKASFGSEIESYLHWNKDKRRKVEIAFYGGNFTGLEKPDQERLLSWADRYIQERRVDSIRISTRPDDIDRDGLIFLRDRGVRTIELGAQSFDDDVLKRASRGHDAQATIDAVKQIKDQGFKIGIHLMAGLPGDSREIFLDTLNQTVKLAPDMVRIHPTLVLSDTRLADLYRQGLYQPLSIGEAVFRCRLAWEVLAPAEIRIIRFGLQTTPEMSRIGAVLAGPKHPAFGSLVYSSIFYSSTLNLLKDIPKNTRQLRFLVNSRDISNFRGYQNENLTAIKKLYPNADIVIDSDPSDIPGRISLVTPGGDQTSLRIAGI
jgi:histone acetyltransferase (RNA polymerase elongator complex component)